MRASTTIASLAAAAAFAASVPSALAQHATAFDVESGEQAFQGVCANCHGPDGNQVPGIDLGRGQFRRPLTDDEIVGIIRNGIPNTPMPATPGMSEEQALRIVAYLRARAAENLGTAQGGDAVRGRAIFEGKGECLECHRVAGRGSRVGPDLTRIGEVRRADELEHSLLDPAAEVQPANRSYTVKTASGETVTGRLLNHDTFTVELIDSHERLRSFKKSDLESYGFAPTPMPSYRGRLDAQELADVVAYLASLRSPSGQAPAAQTAEAQGVAVTFDRVLHGDREPWNWLSYSGTPSNQRYSRLDQINSANAKNLELQWVWQAHSLEKFEATALVVDGVLYTVQAPNDVVALDASTGRIFWTFTYQPSPDARLCCGRVNRGLAILGDTLFMGTIDAHLVAIDAKSGQPLWDTTVADAAEHYSITMAPLVVEDKVIVGTAGGDMGIRGLIAAFDAHTGKALWKFRTIPAPGEAGSDTWSGDSWKEGGGAVWNAGAYDPDTNLVFFGTGNPAPDWDGRSRLGDNLYSNCVVALDADTGKLAWFYQFTPHDELDYDSTQVPVLADIDWRGAPRKVMLWANRNGVMYVLDRTTGKFLFGKPYVKTNWMDGFDANGRPHRVPGIRPTPEGTLVRPHVHGATNWAPPSFSPKTGLFYVAHWENSGIIAIEGEFPQGVGINKRQTTMGQTNLEPLFNDDDEAYGVIRAYDPDTLEPKWEFRMDDITWGGVLSTAGDVVFGGGKEGYFYALDATTGKLLWKAAVGGQVNSGAMTYAVDGKQYVAVAAGSSLFAFALRE